MLITIQKNTSSSEEIHQALDQILSITFNPAFGRSASIVRYDGCPAIRNEPIDPNYPEIILNWPDTDIGSTQQVPCACEDIIADSNSMRPTRFVSRVCEGTYSQGGRWMTIRDYVKDCGYTQITLQLCQARMLLESSPMELARKLSNITDNTELKAVDISAATTIVQDLTQQAINNKEIRENYLNTVDNLIQADSGEIKQSQAETNASSRLLDSLINFSNNVDLVNETLNSTTLVQRTFAVHINDIDVAKFMGETLIVDLGSVEDAMSTGSRVNRNAINTQPGVIGSMSDRTASVQIPETIFIDLGMNDKETQRISYFVFVNGDLFQSADVNQSDLVLGSVIVSVNINTTTVPFLSNPIVVRFQASQLIENSTRELCGIWDSDRKGGSWLTIDCMDYVQQPFDQPTNEPSLTDDPTVRSTLSYNKTYNSTSMYEVTPTNTDAPTATVRSTLEDSTINNQSPTEDAMMNTSTFELEATFYQTGHFGLLLDLNYAILAPVPPVYTFTLGIISYIGLSLSLISLCLFLITYLSIKQLRTNGHGQVLINICVSLMALYIVFLVAGHVAFVPVLCGITAVLLQYFMLVFFGWTAVEAFYLYRKLVIVLGTHIPKFVFKAALLVWLLPILIVIISVGPGYEYYYFNETANYSLCRSTEYPFWFGLVLPFAIIQIFNWVVFVLIMVSLCKRVQKKMNKDNKVNFVKQQIIITIGLATVFGLGWVFGLVASGTTIPGVTFTLQVIFSIFVGFQGVLFFVLHCLRNKDVRTQWISWFKTLKKKATSAIPSTGTDSHAYNSHFEMCTSSTLPRTSDNSTLPRKRILSKEEIEEYSNIYGTDITSDNQEKSNKVLEQMKNPTKQDRYDVAKALDDTQSERFKKKVSQSDIGGRSVTGTGNDLVITNERITPHSIGFPYHIDDDVDNTEC